MNNLFSFENKSILITGAGSGIGRTTALALSNYGAKLLLVDFSQDGLEETISMIGCNHIGICADLSLDESFSSIEKAITENHIILSGIVHCAGISSRKPLNVLSKEGFSKVMDVNFFSFVELVKKFTKKKYFKDGGSIVVMSSISSIKGYKAKTEYCVSKASVDAFVRCSALELAPRSIRINSVMAAEVLTPMALKAKELSNSLGAVPELNAPLGPTQPYEVANTIVFLLSDATKTITGTSVLIDGGATI